MFWCVKCVLRNVVYFQRTRNVLHSKLYKHNIKLIRQCSTNNDKVSLNSFTRRSHHCGELRSSHVGEDVTLYGWVLYQRMGGQFIVLRDSHGIMQVTMSNSKKQDLISLMSRVTAESVIEVTGKVSARPPGQENKNMATGDVEVIAKDIKILNSCNKNIPFHIHDFHQVKESLRIEYRYLDLRNTEMQRNLRLRSKVIMKMREYLCNLNGFVDVETPTLFRRTPGGAREFVVPTHSPGKFFCLPQSPQQFKQLLMVGGIDRYMQIARCYRDEQAKPDRQPEFTQLDLEMSFVTQEDIKELVEGLLSSVWPDHLPPLTLPLPRLPYAQAIAQYGSDKPDTRFEMKLQDITPVLTKVHKPNLYQLAESAAHYPRTSVQAINFTEAGKHLSNKNLKELSKVAELFVRDMNEKPWFAVTKVLKDRQWQGSLADNLGFDLHNVLNLHLNLQEDDLLLLSAGEHTSACTLLGKLRLEIATMMEAKGENIFGERDKMNLLWVEDFPLFLPKEDGSSGLESAHHPFTAPHSDDVFLVHTQPEVARSQHYDLVLNGSEIGGGSIRIHDSSLQEYILSQVLKEDSSTMSHLLEALQYGCPPHGGIALGLDRLFAIFCGSKSIRDVIAFPKTSKGEDIMAKAPGTISKSDANYYHIKSIDEDSD